MDAMCLFLVIRMPTRWPSGPPAFLNLTAGNLLNELLRVELSAAGELIEGEHREHQFPYLSHGRFLYYVRDHRRAAQVALGAVNRTGLAPFTQIFFCDEAEGFLRCLHPNPGDGMLLSQFAQECAALAKLAAAELSLWREAQRWLGGPG